MANYVLKMMNYVLKMMGFLKLMVKTGQAGVVVSVRICSVIFVIKSINCLCFMAYIQCFKSISLDLWHTYVPCSRYVHCSRLEKVGRRALLLGINEEFCIKNDGFILLLLFILLNK